MKIIFPRSRDSQKSSLMVQLRHLSILEFASTRLDNRTKLQRSAMHQDDAKERGEAYRVEVPSDAPIVQGLKRMRESENRGIQKLFDVAYYIAKQGRPLTDFESLIALEKMHGVDFLGTSYEN